MLRFGSWWSKTDWKKTTLADPASHPARVDLENFEVRRTVLLPAPRDRVWAALTTPEQLTGWFGQTARIEQLAVGGTGGFGWTAYPGEFPMVIRELEPQRVFAFTWGTRGQPIRSDNATTARFTLEDAEGGTLLTVVESGFEALAGDPLAAMEDNREGWDHELDDLLAYLNEG